VEEVTPLARTAETRAMVRPVGTARPPISQPMTRRDGGHYGDDASPRVERVDHRRKKPRAMTPDAEDDAYVRCRLSPTRSGGGTRPTDHG
jgi:hypothetical protein